MEKEQRPAAAAEVEVAQREIADRYTTALENGVRHGACG
jgi:hypothetical protein